jgi:hypothetical protein
MTNTAELAAMAVSYAAMGWPVFPLRGKVPFKGTRGHLDATTDPALAARWWCDVYRGANIGGRVPESMIVIDLDPYHGAFETLRAHGHELPHTLTDYSGRGDDGAHYWFRRPPGKLSGKRLGAGIDLKTSTGYVVLPPSIHPDTGKPYVRVDRPVAAPPDWLCDLLRVAPPPAVVTRPKPLGPFRGPSIADEFTANTSWFDILAPHGWACLDANPDADGARWLHPKATSTCSATVQHGCLFVWSTNTDFEVTEESNPHGYTKFRAHALLNYGGNMSAAARALRGVAR